MSLRSFIQKPRNVIVLALLALAGVSILLNKGRPPIEEKTDPVLPPIDATDEADRLLQQASENYFFHEFDKGVENYRKAIALFEARNRLDRAARVYESMGDMYAFANEPEEAKTSYLKAVEVHQQIKDALGQGRALKRVGNLLMKLNEVEPAGEWYRKAALAVKEEAPHPDKAEVYEALGQYYRQAGNVKEAIVQFTLAKDTFTALNHEMGVRHMTNVIDVLEHNKPPSTHGTGRHASGAASGPL